MSTMTMPRRTREAIAAAARAAEPQTTIMLERKGEFMNPLTPKLVAIASSEKACRKFDDTLDAMWANTKTREAEEIIVGGGFHAAVYCAIRVQQGHPRPLVIDASPHPGGVFAVSRGPAFYLNSRNRPGNLGIPGTEGALNVIPGAPVQPSDLSGDEYQRNSDVAFCVRATLAMYGDVLAGRAVAVVEEGFDGQSLRRYRLTLDNGDIKYADRVIFATGIGEETKFDGAVRDNERVMYSREFMAMMDRPFPLRGMGRVAVVGCGDSGRVVIEALTGQGPTTGMSVASLDYPDVIDWYGLSRIAVTREAWEGCNRSRYRGIGRLLPRQSAPDKASRIVAKDNAMILGGGFECAYVDETPYDYVIVCTGYAMDGFRDIVPEEWSLVNHLEGNRQVARRFNSEDVWFIGPAAQLDLNEQEMASFGSAIKENSTALFRYAARTATLAANIAAPPPRAKGTRAKGMATKETLTSFLDMDGELLVIGAEYLYKSDIDKWVGILLGESGGYPVFRRRDGETNGYKAGGESGYALGNSRVARTRRTTRGQLDANGDELVIGMTYEVNRSSRKSGPLIGLSDESVQYVGVDDANLYFGFGIKGGGYKINGETVYGMLSTSMVPA